MGGLCHCSSGWKKEALAFFPLLSLEILQKDLKASKSNGMVQQDGHRKKTMLYRGERVTKEDL